MLRTLFTGLLLAMPYAVWCKTQASEDYRNDLAEAIRRRILRKQAAEAMKLDEQALCKQLALNEPLNTYRLADLFSAYPEVEAELLKLRAARRGFRLFDDAAFGRLIDAVTALAVRARRQMKKESA